MDVFSCTGSYDVNTVWMGVGRCLDVGSSIAYLYI